MVQLIGKGHTAVRKAEMLLLSVSSACSVMEQALEEVLECCFAL